MAAYLADVDNMHGVVLHDAANAELHYVVDDGVNLTIDCYSFHRPPFRSYRMVQIQQLRVVFVDDDAVASFEVVAGVVAGLLKGWLDDVALLVVADAGCIVQYIFHIPQKKLK